MPTARTAAAGRRPQRARRSSGASRPSVGGIRWDRVARISLLVVMGLILLSYIGPAAKYIEAWQLSNDTKSELTQLQGENKQLKQRYEQLREPRHIEAEARRLGMAKPGEKPYVIKQPKKTGPE